MDTSYLRLGFLCGPRQASILENFLTLLTDNLHLPLRAMIKHTGACDSQPHS